MIKRVKTKYWKDVSYIKCVYTAYELTLESLPYKIFQFIIQNFERDDMTSWNYIGTDYDDVEKVFLSDLDKFLEDY